LDKLKFIINRNIVYIHFAPKIINTVTQTKSFYQHQRAHYIANLKFQKCPIFAYAEMYGKKNYAWFLHMQKCIVKKMMPDFPTNRNKWPKKSCPIPAYAEMKDKENDARFPHKQKNDKKNYADLRICRNVW